MSKTVVFTEYNSCKEESWARFMVMDEDEADRLAFELRRLKRLAKKEGWSEADNFDVEVYEGTALFEACAAMNRAGFGCAGWPAELYTLNRASAINLLEVLERGDRVARTISNLRNLRWVVIDYEE